MNRETCLTEVWDKQIKFNNKYFPDWKNTNEIYYSNALAGETGELCNLVKHRCNDGTNKNKDISDNKLLEELADIFIYLELMIESKNLDITTFALAIENKLNKNIIRMENIK